MRRKYGSKQTRVTLGKIGKKRASVPKKLSDLSTGQLKELCDGVDKSLIAIWRDLYKINLRHRMGKRLHSLLIFISHNFS